jgi:tRNA(adenine34) deaminase
VEQVGILSRRGAGVKKGEGALSGRSPEEQWMALALKEAEAALAEGEEPVGAIVLDPETGRVVARAHHQAVALRDPTAHAVMVALTQLAGPLEEEGLEGPGLAEPCRALVLVTSREPCLMCAGAILLHEQVRRVIYGAACPGLGAFRSSLNVLAAAPAGRSLEIAGGVLDMRCAELLRRHATARRARAN